MSDQIDQIRAQMFAKFEKDKTRKEEECIQTQEKCEHTYTIRSRVSADGKEQIIRCNKCGHQKLRVL